MLDLNNLYWEEEQNINLIKSTAQKVWGNNAQLGEIKAISSPYPEFEWPMKLYGRFDVKLEYDRSILAITILANDVYTWLNDLTEENVFKWFESMKPENLLHNFEVLDRLVRDKNKIGTP